MWFAPKTNGFVRINDEVPVTVEELQSEQRERECSEYDIEWEESEVNSDRERFVSEYDYDMAVITDTDNLANDLASFEGFGN